MSAAAFDEWLRRLETRTPSTHIVLGLERVAEVWQRLGAPRVAQTTIIFAGTNGKGSCVALTEAILHAQGLTTAAYTSPHLLRFSERLRIQTRESQTEDWVRAFAAIEEARAEISLTYFEFTTLAAFWLLSRQVPLLDVALLEVGLGGRLDAVNLMDADAALLTSIDLDHQDWLGTNREQIGAEKAGVLRRGQVAVTVECAPPQALVAQAQALGLSLAQLGRDYQLTVHDAHGQDVRTHGVCGYETSRPRMSGPEASGPETNRPEASWSWWVEHGRMEADLPRPALPGAFQFAHAAAVLTLLEGLAQRGRLPALQRTAIEQGLCEVRLAGRRQRMPRTAQGGIWLLDVGHNPQAARGLAEELRVQSGATWCVLGMLRDKDNASFVDALRPVIAGWFLFGLQGARGQSATELAARSGLEPAACYDDMAKALEAAAARAAPGDCILITGSFHTVAAALERLRAAVD